MGRSKVFKLTMPIVYILTNESMPDIIKIGIIGFLAEFISIHEIFLLFGILAGLCGIAGLLHPKVRYLN